MNETQAWKTYGEDAFAAWMRLGEEIRELSRVYHVEEDAAWEDCAGDVWNEQKQAQFGKAQYIAWKKLKDNEEAAWGRFRETKAAAWEKYNAAMIALKTD